MTQLTVDPDARPTVERERKREGPGADAISDSSSAPQRREDTEEPEEQLEVPLVASDESLGAGVVARKYAPPRVVVGIASAAETATRGRAGRRGSAQVPCGRQREKP